MRTISPCPTHRALKRLPLRRKAGRAPSAIALTLVLAFLSSAPLVGCSGTPFASAPNAVPSEPGAVSVKAAEATAASQEPSFTSEELAYAAEHKGFKHYDELDDLGRCGTAVACLGPETMPAEGEERESIGMIKPTGWHTVRYEGVDGEYLYNRCHLIGWQLSAENANERNLVTGTRWMNTEEMLAVENKVADYIHGTGNHVLYRATPVFEGDELVCRGVLLEAQSIEDGGTGISESTWCPNTQPGIIIDYETGDNREETDGSALAAASAAEAAQAAETEGPGGAADEQDPASDAQDDAETAYILNTNTRRFHDPSCSSVDEINPQNRSMFSGERAELVAQGYRPCGRCNP